MAKKKTIAKKAAAAAKKSTPAAKKKPAATKKITRPKKPAPKKAQTTQTKKAAPATTAERRKGAEGSRRSARLSQKGEASEGSLDLQKLMGNGTHQTDIALLPGQFMKELMIQIEGFMAEFQTAAENNLTAAQRRRKIGPGVRNYGFIDKVSDIAFANPQYAQFFAIDDLKNCIRNIEMLRDLALLLQSFARAVTNTMLIYSTDASLMARDYYHTVQRQALRGDPTAMELERALRIFFHRSKSAAAEPTIRESERDAHAILTHKKDGKIIIEGKSPKVKGGVTKVIDDVHKSKGSFKESEEGSFED